MAPARCSCSCRPSAATRCPAARCTCRRPASMSTDRPADRHVRLDASDQLARVPRRSSRCHRLPMARRPLYLCGHSLGLVPLAAPRAACSRNWTTGHGWACAAITTRDATGSAMPNGCTLRWPRLAGAREHEVVAMNSLTVNLHLLMASFYRPRGSAAASSSRPAPSLPTGMPWPARCDWHGLDAGDALIEIAPPPAQGDLSMRRQLEAAARDARRRDRAGAVARRAVPHRPRFRPRAHLPRRTRGGRALRLRPRPCHRQPAAGAA